MDDLAKRLQDKDTRVAELERLLTAAQAASAEAPIERGTGSSDEGIALGGDAELLAMKERALSLMQFYLERLAQRSTAEGAK